MSDAVRLLNPCVFHLQKLGLELKCPLCLGFLSKPVLLPCNHIMCNSCIPKSSQFSTNCPACQQCFTDQEIRPASYMENIVGIYKSLGATFNSAILPVLSSVDSGSPVSMAASLHQPWKKSSELAADKKRHSDAMLVDSSGPHLNKISVSEEFDVNHAPQISPGSSPSCVDAKDAGGLNSAPGSVNGSSESQRVTKSAGDNLGTCTVGNNDTFHTLEHKRQKKLNYGSSEAVLQSHGHRQQSVFHPDQPVVSNSNKECKSMECTPVISNLAPCDTLDADRSVCAFCHTSKIAEGTGPLLHYANGKAVIRDEITFSNAVPVHSKCIEWTPQVYFAGEIIMNLESELARASKLKCTKCGLKGAALGCFARSCRRTYHVPCAMEVVGCRWDCEDFLMLCPAHKSVKFPSERSKSGKRCSEDKHSLPTPSSSVESNFWAASPDGPREWVLCGSALSSEEKSLLFKFAKISGASVVKSWNPNVTHVIAATDLNGACSRTLKVLMAILNGRWILTVDWISACMDANCPVNEEPYEVNLDNHGFREGPKTGRLKLSNNAPKLFDGLIFYFIGDFIPSFKSDLLNLVRAGGGIIIENTEQMVRLRHDSHVVSTTFVVYNHDTSQRCLSTAEATSLISKRLAESEDVAKGINALVIPHTWILESIAACTVLPYPLP